MDDKNKELCELCGCKTKLTCHHLIPQSLSKHKYKYLKTDKSNFLWICDVCHKYIHATYSEIELKKYLNTKEKLLESEKIKNFINWRKKHQNFTGSSKLSNKKHLKR